MGAFLSIFYSRSFYDRDYVRTTRSAAAIVPFLLKNLGASATAIDSVIDIGCGRGVWLQEFAKSGAVNIKGRDGPWVLNDRLLIPPQSFEQTDLSKPFVEALRYDLAMTLEVAEHIHDENAESFVDNIVRLSDTIMFSAAIEGQGGQHHVNERPLSYWIKLFAERGYQVHDCVRPYFWDDANVCWWYRQNIVIFSNEASRYRDDLSRLESQSPKISDIAHPDGFREKAKLANIFSPEEYVGLWISNLKRKIGFA